MLKLIVSLLAVSSAHLAAARAVGTYASSSWNLTKFTSLVLFGDSYSDDSREYYFVIHGGDPPPVGWRPTVNTTVPASDGGRPWPTYVGQYSGANIYNYAVSGAACSNYITPRYINFPFLHGKFPSVAEYGVPAYIADSNAKKFLHDGPATTVYTIWVGGNDLNSFISDTQVNDTNIEDYMDCVYDQVQILYDHGARYFVLMNTAPFNLAPLYALPNKGGVGPNQFWLDKPKNLTDVSYRMTDLVAGVNGIYQYRTPYVAEVERKYPCAHFALYDVHSLFTDIYNHPSKYLNGTAPPSVTGHIHNCNPQGQACNTSSSPDSFLWYDELHPSEQTNRIIAKNFVDVVKGTSKWATYWN